MMHISGLDEFSKKLGVLAEDAQSIAGENSIPFSDLFNIQFMTSNTRFTDLDSMFATSPFRIESQSDFENLPLDQLDDFVRSCTGFSGWQEMFSTATTAWIERQMGF